MLEEVFFRRWLQTRLEVLSGPILGLLVAALAFGLMHLGSHGQGLWWWPDRVAAVVAQQGVVGLLLGYLWSRYRRLWPPILLHIGINGLPVLVFLSGG
ncbi:hypothetical protein CGZ93_04525 [Enemella dayhoffiae]|uniref:CAAX prenyl protease 2/Lysostaphin resistance protein A-like domain-containing protein n=1 Tax=Enemella dayhoffiae TaxID=2016507 RepID=A0A255H8P3_9ACTN|nr:CPBP family intramembrane glutamic endopeptidase [Enemella dayhoffiae]OYO24090.1 hypothetical protein CGZ93_04525 [Enemella dayhoffiae]